MKCYKLIIIILMIFVKSGNVLSNEKIFNVNKSNDLDARDWIQYALLKKRIN